MKINELSLGMLEGLATAFGAVGAANFGMRFDPYLGATLYFLIVIGGCLYSGWRGKGMAQAASDD